jgi:hypothetical protein
MTKTDKNIIHFLKEMSGSPKVVYHYTNTKNLSGMLKSGDLKPSDYEINLDTEKKIYHGKYERPKVTEIATIRPSALAHQTLDDISENIGKVKLIIKTHILADKVRGVSTKPIAEFPLRSVNDVRDEFIKIGFENKVATRNAHRVLAAYKRMSNAIRGDLPGKIDRNSALVDEFKKWLEQTFHVDLPVNSFVDAGDEMLYYWRNREGEERISLKKGGSVPLDPVYLKIELIKGFTEDFEQGYLRQTDYSGQEIMEVAQWKRYLEKWDNLFEKNDEYYKFKNKLRSLQREYGTRALKVSPKAKKTIGNMIGRKGSKIEKPIIMPKLKDL